MILDVLAYIVLSLMVAAGVFSMWLGWRKDPETFTLLSIAFVLVALALWRLFG